jgi:hypothetical protein
MNYWPTKKLGEKEYFEILGSGIEKFEGEKEYLSTSSIEGNKIIAPECKITYQKRPSRANIQPRLNSVWFARMINTIKVYSFTEDNKDEIDKYILSTGFAGILCNPEKVNPRYLEKIFLSKWFNDLKDSLANDKAIQKSLNNDDIEKLEIPLPPLLIQQKIVKILDTIQEAIDIHDKIIEKTKELKKSMMAELFKYGAPSFRKGRKLKKTEIGEIPEDWEVERLGEVIEILDSKRIPLSEEERQNMKGPYPYCGANGIIDYINNYIFEGEYVLLAEDGGYWGPFEESSYIMKGKFWVNNHAHIFRALKNKAINFYLMSILNYLNLNDYISGATRGKLNQSTMRNIKIPLPSLPEQQEISEILQIIDQKIEIEKKKKELYQELFKTMLHKIMSQEIDINLLDY